MLTTGDGFDGVEPDSLELTLLDDAYAGEWRVTPQRPVSNCVVHVDGENQELPVFDFHEQATLTVVSSVPALPLVAVLALGTVLGIPGRRRWQAR
ncbi:MAG: hypothetical protein OXG72_19115 [Acidobacteria bacterium]|nr:hypothetical protein [Acidobacteriota bacterium]